MHIGFNKPGIAFRYIKSIIQLIFLPKMITVIRRKKQWL